jgi:hypothetical protein
MKRRLTSSGYEQVGQARGPGLRYDHLKAPAEPMLWVADAVAWAWTHDGRWRAQVDRLVARVTQL